MKVHLLLSLFLVITSSECVIHQCTEYAATSMQQTKLLYQTHYYSCGWYGWSSCETTSSYTVAFTVYQATIGCCQGYSGINCTAHCTLGCSINSECSLPELCTCIEGWKGDDCLTDINECSDNIDLCEYNDHCINTDGSYECDCDQDHVPANDGYHCLESVTDLILKPGKRTVKLEFFLPPSFQGDGELEGYYVNCSSDVHETYEVHHVGNVTTLNVVGLIPFTTYTCCMQPVWIENGIGPEACAEIDTLQDAPDTPPYNVSIQTVSERSALIKWDPPEILNGILLKYQIYINYTNNTPIHHIDLDPVYSFFLHEYLLPHQTVGMSISAFTVGGESPMSGFQFTTTFQDEPGAVDDLTVDVLASHAVNITWLPPEALNGILLSYHMNITRESSSGLELFYSIELEPQEEFYVTLDNLEPYVPYTVTVGAATVIGLGEVFPVTFFTNQEVPSLSPQFKVTIDSPVSITVSWVPLALWELRGFLSHYQVVFAETISECNDTLNEQVFNTTQTKVSTSIDPLLEYCIYVSAATHMGFGQESAFWYLKEYENSVFEVNFLGVEDCKQWLESELNYKIDAALGEISQSLNTYCSCDIQRSYFDDAQFTCNELDKDRVILQARVAGTSQSDSKTLLDYLQLWIQNSPNVTIRGERLSTDARCDVAIESIGDISDCNNITRFTEYPSMSDGNLTAEEIVSIVLGSAGIGCLMLIAALIGLLCFTKFKPSKKRARPVSQAIDLRAPLEDENDDDKLLLITNSDIAPEPAPTEQRDVD